MSDANAAEHRYTAEHPLLSLTLYPPVKVMRALGIDRLGAIRLLEALACGIWTALLFLLMAQWGLRLVDAAIFTVLASVSAASMFWFAVPESFAFGSLTIIAALLLTLWPRNVPPVIRYAIAMGLSLSITVTNAMVGLFAAARRLKARDLWIAGVSAWFAVTMLWVVEKLLFPATEFFFPPRTSWAQKFLYAPTPERIGEVLQNLFASIMVMPRIEVLGVPDADRPGAIDRVMSVQHSAIGSTGLIGWIATLDWLALFGLGLWAAWKARSGLSVLCLMILGAQMALHIVFGAQTFLYGLHILPLLVILAAGVTFTRARKASLALAAVAIVCAGMNNWREFQHAVAIVDDVDAQARTFATP